MHKELITPLTADRVLEVLAPFPIVLATTRTNIITINQIAYFTFSPLRIGIAVDHRRFTHGLLRSEGEFVVNVPDVGLIEAVKTCGSISGRDQDKFALTGLTREPSSVVRSVSILECGAHIECRIEREVEFEERTWFIAQVAASRKRPGHDSRRTLLCGRTHYTTPGEILSAR